jgi:precorrin-6B methylase 2
LLDRCGRGGLAVELGCGSGLLTRELVGAGHRVIATDASAMTGHSKSNNQAVSNCSNLHDGGGALPMAGCIACFQAHSPRRWAWLDEARWAI